MLAVVEAAWLEGATVARRRRRSLNGRWRRRRERSGHVRAVGCWLTGVGEGGQVMHSGIWSEGGAQRGHLTQEWRVGGPQRGRKRSAVWRDTKNVSELWREWHMAQGSKLRFSSPTWQCVAAAGRPERPRLHIPLSLTWDVENHTRPPRSLLPEVWK